MSSSSEQRLPEREESLWVLTVSPTVWAAHFMASYITAAVWCAKFADSTGSLWPARMAIAIYTVVAMVGICVNGWIGLRRARVDPDTVQKHQDTPLGRHRFLGFATLLLSILSGVATLFSAAVVVFMETCE
ncbi:hypothetical protein Mal4_52330 [Maioricimonas rarisocia]|uniref:Uncharacterized protein n=1 Tax=Maioricimonas rarisocia TaxID=2528026 RepID=A0A517ZEF6_9PLAN|nr:hypothetical protein [Maioricimonas rarisocia]QDU40870.1 hypothetical protein Mal4_52330 [Maioricimonas rarisocia]